MIRRIVVKIFLVAAVLYALLALLTPMGALLPLWLLLAFQDAGVRHPITVELNGTLDGRPFTVAETVVCTADGHILGNVEPNLTETPDFLMHVTESGERVVFPIQGLCDEMVWPKHEWGGWVYRIKTGKRFLPMTFFLGLGTPPEEATAYVSEVAYDNPDSRISLSPVKIQEGEEAAVREGAQKLREILAPKYEAVSVTVLQHEEWVNFLPKSVDALKQIKCGDVLDDRWLRRNLVFTRKFDVFGGGRGAEVTPDQIPHSAREMAHGLATSVTSTPVGQITREFGVLNLAVKTVVGKVDMSDRLIRLPEGDGGVGILCDGTLQVAHRIYVEII